VAAEQTRTLRLSVTEGTLAAVMVGLGELWFVADAVRLGGSPIQLSLLVTLPQLVGSIGSVAMLRSLRAAGLSQGGTPPGSPHGPLVEVGPPGSALPGQPLLRGPPPSGVRPRPVFIRRKRVVAAVVAQALVLATLSGLALAGWQRPWGLVLAACAYQLFGQAAGNGWSSWIGDLVPARIRGRYFGRRNRWVHGTTFVALVAGGLLLHATEPRAAEAMGAGGLGFAVLYGLAALFRLGSAVLLLRSYEPPFTPPAVDDRLRTVLTGSEGAPARGVVLSGSLVLLAVCVGSPFFAPYMLGELRFSYTTYLVAQGFIVIAKVVALPLWGRAVDRYGPRRVYTVAVLLIGLIPLPWIGTTEVAIVCAAQVLSGTAWAASEVGLLSLTLAAAPPRRRSVLLAAQSVAHGVAQFAGGLLGAGLLHLLPGRFAVLFAVTAALRLLVAALVPRLLAAVPSPAGPPPPGRVVGWVPHGGLIRRLVARDDEE
jgi:MFS family permease